MKGAAAAALALLLPAAAACDAPASEPRELHLITPLPLLFGEQFGLDSEKAAVGQWLEQRFRLNAIDLPSQAPAGGLLLMVQPRALPAEELVALDAWVRGGGRLLLLADPRLEWPSERPLGDPLRAPPMFADTGLLGHWGLRLDAPEASGEEVVDGVRFVSPGRLVRTGGTCAIEDGLVAACRIGRGTAIVVADADWLMNRHFAANRARLAELLNRLAR